jgi:hypothetical protein
MKTKKIKNIHKDPNATGRFWHGVEVREANEPLRIIVRPEDVVGAKKKDWQNCAFAKACKRLYGSTKVAFFHCVAYIELKDEKGKAWVERYQMPRTMREKVEHFDKTGEMPEGGFTLKAVGESYKLDSKAAVDRKRRERKHKRGAARRPEPAILGEAKTRRQAKPKEVDWRIGTGQVHFVAANPVVKAK